MSKPKTKAKIRVTMPDGSKWDVPAQVVADDRDAHYADEDEDTIGFIRGRGLDKYDLLDWAANNLNWDEVSQHAVKVFESDEDVDYQDGWINGEKRIVGEI